jgi:hypothetical protein
VSPSPTAPRRHDETAPAGAARTHVTTAPPSAPPTPRRFALAVRLGVELDAVRGRAARLAGELPHPSADLLAALDRWATELKTPAEALATRRRLTRLTLQLLATERSARAGRALAERARRQLAAAVAATLPTPWSARLDAPFGHAATDPVAIRRQLLAAEAIARLTEIQERLTLLRCEARPARQRRLAELLRPPRRADQRPRSR